MARLSRAQKSFDTREQSNRKRKTTIATTTTTTPPPPPSPPPVEFTSSNFKAESLSPDPLLAFSQGRSTIEKKQKKPQLQQILSSISPSSTISDTNRTLVNSHQRLNNMTNNESTKPTATTTTTTKTLLSPKIRRRGRPRIRRISVSDENSLVEKEVKPTIKSSELGTPSISPILPNPQQMNHINQFHNETYSSPVSHIHPNLRHDDDDDNNGNYSNSGAESDKSVSASSVASGYEVNGKRNSNGSHHTHDNELEDDLILRFPSSDTKSLNTRNNTRRRFMNETIPSNSLVINHSGTYSDDSMDEYASISISKKRKFMTRSSNDNEDPQRKNGSHHGEDLHEFHKTASSSPTTAFNLDDDQYRKWFTIIIFYL